MSAAPLTWVVGAGGLLGSAVTTRYAGHSPAQLWALTSPILWADEGSATHQLSVECARFVRHAIAANVPWRILWCAGAGVVATDPDRLEQETRVFQAFIVALQTVLMRSEVRVPGSFFFASSAGAVYAGSSMRPAYTEFSSVGTLSAYGREKLLQEKFAETLAETKDTKVLVGRISNLYGPGQNPGKNQGLVTHIGRAALKREPFHLYVPLDTIRDYLFASDAAALIAKTMDRLEVSIPPRSVRRIIASGVGTSVASVLAAWRSVLRRPPGSILASNPASKLQPSTLTFRTTVWPDIRIAPISMMVGIHAVHGALLAELRAGRL